RVGGALHREFPLVGEALVLEGDVGRGPGARSRGPVLLGRDVGAGTLARPLGHRVGAGLQPGEAEDEVHQRDEEEDREPDELDDGGPPFVHEPGAPGAHCSSRKARPLTSKPSLGPIGPTSGTGAVTSTTRTSTPAPVVSTLVETPSECRADNEPAMSSRARSAP